MSLQLTNTTVLIVGGSGKMGQWFRSFFENAGITVTVYGRKSPESLKQACERADIIMISVPISETVKTIHSVIPLLNKNQLLCDITSLKVLPVKAMGQAKCGVLGMHPLFGPSILSPLNQKIVFCPVKSNHLSALLQSLFQRAGMEIIEMSPKEHDMQTAYIQALTHAVNILYAKSLTDADHQIDTRLQTPLFTLQQLVTGRVLEQDPLLIKDIELNNPYFESVLTSFVNNASQLLTWNKEKNSMELESMLHNLHASGKSTSSFILHETNKILSLLREKPIQMVSLNETQTISECKIVAFLGPKGTNSFQAAFSKFPHAELVEETTIIDAIRAVSSQKVQAAVVPSENSQHGTVRETFDALANLPVYVVGSFDIPIHHTLLSLDQLTSITNVVSHPQALAQCSEWLGKNLPDATLTPSLSTTSSLINPKPHTAYIAPKIASAIYSVPIIADQIENTGDNTTRFFVIMNTDSTIEHLRNSRTLLFLTIYNRVGILRDILEVFARHTLNVMQLESRPSSEKLWDYCFFIEIDKVYSHTSVRLALQELGKFCTTIRVLGRT